jgi:RHS repeat-associated protein
MNNLTTIVNTICATLLLFTSNTVSAHVRTTHYRIVELNEQSQVETIYQTHLIFVTNPSPEFFDFDPAGNLLSIANSPTATPGFVKGNRLLIQGDKKFEYDARGNLIQETRGKDGKLKKTFAYNLQNQLIKVETNSEHETVSYKYDPLGRRIQKTDKFGTTTFLWTDNLLAQETRNKIKKTYLFEPGSFRPLAQVQDDQVYHYHLDHLGTPRELTNEQGKIVWKAKYKTYGNLALKEVEEVENNLRFQGQYFDEETGLHYNRFRYYSPDTGQFINQDPIGLLGGINNYQYAPNPVEWIDPLGLCKEVATPITDPSRLLSAPKYSTTHTQGELLESFKVGSEGLLLPGGRAHGPGSPAGGFLSETPIPDQNYVRESLATLPEWNKATHVSDAYVPPGVILQRSVAGPQGPGYPGGGVQLEILNPSDKVKVIYSNTTILGK